MDCLLILAELQGNFVNFYGVQQEDQETEGAHYLIDYPDNCNHFHQITQSGKMLITATRWNHSLTLLEWNRKLHPLASLQQFGTEEQLP